MEEIWKVIKDSDGHYFISNLGRLKREEYEFVDSANKRHHRDSYVKEKGCLNKRNGYYYYHFRDNKGSHNSTSVHRLVAMHFVDNPLPEEYDQVNHLDGNKANNVFSNLEWCNEKLNMEHASKHGLINRDSEKRKEQARINQKKSLEVMYRPVASYDAKGNLVKIFKETNDGCIVRLTYKGFTYRYCDILKEKYGEIPKHIDVSHSYKASKLKRKKYIEHTINNETNVYFRLKDLPITREQLWVAFNHSLPDTAIHSIWDIEEVFSEEIPKSHRKGLTVLGRNDEGEIVLQFNSLAEVGEALNFKGFISFNRCVKEHTKYRGYFWEKIYD